MNAEETKNWHGKERVVHPVHYLMHIASGLIVFLLGLCADVYIVERIRNQPRATLWIGGRVETNVVISQGLPNSSTIQVGLRQDGAIIWRDPWAIALKSITNEVIADPAKWVWTNNGTKMIYGK